MYDALFISLILHVVISFMPSQTTKQQTMVLTRTTKGSSDCSDVNNLTPILLFYFQHTSGCSIFCSDPSPRASYGPSGVLQLLVTSGYYSSIDATTIPPGLLNPGYKMSIVQSTLDCSLVPTVMLSQYTSITVLVTSTWWLSLTVDHFCFAKFKKLTVHQISSSITFFMYPRFLRFQAWTPLLFARIWNVYNSVFPLSASHITKRYTGSSIQLFASSTRNLNWNNHLEKNQHETHTFDWQ